MLLMGGFPRSLIAVEMGWTRFGLEVRKRFCSLGTMDFARFRRGWRYQHVISLACLKDNLVFLQWN